MASVWERRLRSVRTTTQLVSARSWLVWLANLSGSVSCAEEVAVSAQQQQSHHHHQLFQLRPVKTITQLVNARSWLHKLVTSDGLVSYAEELAGSVEFCVNHLERINWHTMVIFIE